MQVHFIPFSCSGFSRDSDIWILVEICVHYKILVSFFNSQFRSSHEYTAKFIGDVQVLWHANKAKY